MEFTEGGGMRSRAGNMKRHEFATSFDEMKLVSKWREAVGLPKTPNTEDLWVNEMMTNAFVFVLGTTMLYLGHVYVIPVVFIQFGETAVFLMKIYVTVVYIQSLAYWACTKLYSTQQIYSQQRPGVGNPGTPNFPGYDQPQSAVDMEGKSALNASYQAADHDGNGHKVTNDPFAKEKELLSWQWCEACQINRPPRAQHCKLCNVCVLKRVHHCYVLNCCIGFSNQRHLLMMCAFFSFACGMSGLVGLYYGYLKIYMNEDVWSKVEFWDGALPYTVYRWWYYGAYETVDLIIFIVMHVLLGVGGVISGYGFYEMVLVVTGKTSYEIEKNLRIKDSMTLGERVTEVFGKFWFINFILPGNLVMKQQGDGCSWEHVKIDYSETKN